MNAHSQVIRKALQLLLFVGMLLGVALLRPAPIARAVNTSADCFALSNEPPGNLISTLLLAGYGPFDMYDALEQIVADTNPSVSGIITPAFLQALESAPPSSEIFTTQLKDVLASGNTVEICTDGTVQYKTIYGSTYYAQGYPTLVSNISGVGAANFTYSTDPNTPLTSWTTNGGGLITITYKVFGIAWGQPRYYLPLVTKSQ